jgi:hypothetical protein
MDVNRAGQPAGGTRLSVCAPSCSTTSMFAHSATKSNALHTRRRRCSKQEPGAWVVAWLAGLRLDLSHITSAGGPSSDLCHWRARRDLRRRRRSRLDKAV